MQGLWTVEFGSTKGEFGGGVVVFNGKSISGGDSSYFYTGTIDLKDDQSFTAILDVEPFLTGAISVFNTIGTKFQLNLSGNLVDQRHAIAQGVPVSMPSIFIGVKLTKRA